MRRIHKPEAEPGFIRAVAAVLFLAVCAYVGAAFFGKLDQDTLTVPVRRVTLADSLELQGLAVRREQPVCSRDVAELLAGEGLRLPAGGELARLRDGSLLRAPCSAVFYSGCDGYELLSPDMLRGLSVEKLQELLNTKPEIHRAAIGRLVTDYCWYFAALTETPAALPEKGNFRLLFQDTEHSVPAELVSASSGSGKTALLLRLNCGGDEYMSLRQCGAELIFSEYAGLEVPEEAVHMDDDGNEFVYTLTAGVVERKAVEIIYTDGGRCLAAISPLADALREGNTLIVSGENVFEGRIIDP